MVEDATCIPIDEARAETPFSATLGTQANEAVRVKLTATPEGLVVEIGFVGADLPEFARFLAGPPSSAEPWTKGPRPTCSNSQTPRSRLPSSLPIRSCSKRSSLLRHGGEGAHRVGHTAGLGRKRSGKAPAAWQGAKANRSQSARHEHTTFSRRLAVEETTYEEV